MTTENLDSATEEKNDAVFTNKEVEAIVNNRIEKLRTESRLKTEENVKLKKQLEDMEGKIQKGTATTDEIAQVQTAKKAAEQAHGQGYSPEEMQQFVEGAMQQKELETQLMEAREKDPEFAKLVEENSKTNAVSIEHVVGTAYLPNSVAVIKHLMKDKKSLAVYNAAISNAKRDGGVSAMLVLNNLSDRLADGQAKPHASNYEPGAPLPDSTDESQNFDLTDYINTRY